MEYEEEEELAQCPNCGAIIPADALVCPECGVEFEVEDEEDLTDGLGEELFGDEEVSEEDKDDYEEVEEPEKRGDIGRLLFPSGIILSVLGLGGVAGLRSGVVQSIMGAAPTINTIGSREWIGIGVSVAIFIVGLILIWMWGNSED